MNVLINYGKSSVNLEENGIVLGNMASVIRGLGWETKDDGSIIWYEENGEERNMDGTEAVSPVLTGSNKHTTEEVRDVCSFLKYYNQETNETCGGHIHIGADYLTNVRSYMNLLELWSNNEDIFYTICNKEGDIIRNGAVKKEFPQAAPISKMLLQEIKEGKFKITSNDDVLSLKNKLVELQNSNPTGIALGGKICSRERGINFLNLKLGGKGTIEFRLPNGTINPDVWCQNINLFGGLVVVAQELSQIQMKNSEELTAKEQRKLEIFNDVTVNENCSKEEKAQRLVELLIPQEKNREVYLNRYKINNELLNENSQTQQNIKNHIAEERVVLRSKDIGEWCFLRYDRVDGNEYQGMGEILENKREKRPEKEIMGEYK